MAQSKASGATVDCPLVDRNAAIEYFRTNVVTSMSDSSFAVVYSPQVTMGIDDVIIDGLTKDTVFSGPEVSWLFWVDTEPMARFGHATSFYLIEQATCKVVGPVTGQGWPRINGTSHYMGDDRYLPDDTVWVGQVYREFFQLPGPGPHGSHERRPWWSVLAPAPGDDNICLLIVDGMNTTESAHDVAGAQAALGANNATVLIQPDVAAVCAALQQMAAQEPPCDRLYFYFTGHGFSNSLIVNDEDLSQLSHDSLANCLKETGIAEICTIIDACGQGQFLEAMREAGVPGVHVVSSENEPAFHANEGEEEHWGMSESAGVYSYYLWICLGQGLSLPEAHECAKDSLNAAFDRVLEYLLSQARNSFDSAMAEFRFRHERQKPGIGIVAEFTGDDRILEFMNPPGHSTICIEFSGEETSDTCRNVTLYRQAETDPNCSDAIDPWQGVASWNYNGSSTPRYFAAEGGTGRYVLRDNSNRRPVRVGVTWPSDPHESTPSDPPVYPAYSLGWPNGSGAEFNEGLGAGEYGGVYQTPELSSPHSLCEVPRYLGGPYYWSLLTSYGLLPDPYHPEMYELSDPLAPYAGEMVVTIHAESISDAEGAPLESLPVTLNIYSNDAPVGSADLMFYDMGTPSLPDVQPVAVTLPPVTAATLNLELAMVTVGSSIPGILALDAIEVGFQGPNVSSCCFGRVGDANGLGGDEPTIGDVSTMIDALFISGDPEVIPCLAAADINQSGGVDPQPSDITIGDISVLIDYLFITGPTLGLPNCL
jgi:hypothetical protein